MNKQRPTETTRRLMCKLTQKEIRVYSDELALKVQEQNDTESEKKEATRGFTNLLKDNKRRQGVLSTAISTKKEERDVVCRFEYDMENGLKRTIRTDTGEQVDAIPIPDHERQEVLELEDVMR